MARFTPLWQQSLQLPPRSIHGILFLQSTTLVLLHHSHLPRLLWLSSRPLALHFKFFYKLYNHYSPNQKIHRRFTDSVVGLTRSLSSKPSIIVQTSRLRVSGQPYLAKWRQAPTPPWWRTTKHKFWNFSNKNDVYSKCIYYEYLYLFNI